MAFSDLIPSSAKWLDPAVTPPLQLAIVKRAYLDMDIAEHPPGSNRSATIDQYLRDAGVPESIIASGRGYWCAAALGAWHRSSGAQVPPNYADCDSWVSWAKENGLWLDASKIPKNANNKLAGYSAFYGIKGDASHCGLITRWDDYKRNIEGNTSSGTYSSNGTLVDSKDVSMIRLLGLVRPIARAA